MEKQIVLVKDSQLTSGMPSFICNGLKDIGYLTTMEEHPNNRDELIIIPTHVHKLCKVTLKQALNKLFTPMDKRDRRHMIAEMSRIFPTVQ